MKTKSISRVTVLFLGCLLLVFVGIVSSANALVMTISDGLNSQTITDDDGDGHITYIGSLDSWLINVVTGLSVPMLGEEDAPEMDLASLNVSGGSGTLTITLFDTFNTPLHTGISGFHTMWGGTTGGSVTLDTIINGTTYASFSATGGSFSDAQDILIDPGSPYTMGFNATINHNSGAQVTSFDANIAPVPEPATIILMGSGLIGLGGWVRRRQLSDKHKEKG